MALKTHVPSGRPSHPCVLIEGDEKAGKSWMAAEFTGCERIGQSYWMDLAEGDGEQYIAIPGARYLMVDHEGDYATIYEGVADVHAEAKRARDAGEPPVMFILDPAGPLWDLLSDWARNRANKSKANEKILEEDPNAEINVGHAYWNPAGDRWRRIMTLLLTFPGIVLILARGKEVSAFGADGKPISNKKDYRVEGHKSLGHDATAWVRLARGRQPQIIGGRSTKVDMRPENYKPETRPDFSLEWLIFDALGYDPETARVRTNMEMKPGSDAPESEMFQVLSLAVETADPTYDTLNAIWERVKAAVANNTITAAEGMTLRTWLANRQPKPVDPDGATHGAGLGAALADAAAS